MLLGFTVLSSALDHLFQARVFELVRVSAGGIAVNNVNLFRLLTSKVHTRRRHSPCTVIVNIPDELAVTLPHNREAACCLIIKCRVDCEGESLLDVLLGKDNHFVTPAFSFVSRS